AFVLTLAAPVSINMTMCISNALLVANWSVLRNLLNYLSSNYLIDTKWKLLMSSSMEFAEPVTSRLK
ncbi:MAG: hypothetical protein ABJH72_24330, partial [Reichenbachiella sp.]|uniref:hypothetical protein n=1 Tax=Reichenbachiella sp. TaxID=2184521 RepID=UPI003299A52C